MGKGDGEGKGDFKVGKFLAVVCQVASPLFVTDVEVVRMTAERPDGE